MPKGATLKFEKEYASAGPRPYKGPVAVIVDAGVRSAGETVAGMLKEDGRAYMIGPEATAGMSSQKATINLPSGLFQLYVSVASNNGRFNGGKGIEGIGIRTRSCRTIPRTSRRASTPRSSARRNCSRRGSRGTRCHTTRSDTSSVGVGRTIGEP